MYENYETIVLSPSSEKKALSAAEFFSSFLLEIFQLFPNDDVNVELFEWE